MRTILDCDPGNDDALGILMACGHPGVKLVAVTTGAGHLAHDRTAHNAAITLHLAGSCDVPVAAGAAGPLVRERMIARVLDMESALDPIRPDLMACALDPRPACDVIDVMATGGVTVVTTGPLTNLALALRRAPDLKQRISRIVTLGGAWGLGNKTAAAEWNILCDPEAAAAVFEAGIPITLIPIDAAAGVMISDGLIAATRAVGGPVGSFAAELLMSLVSTFRPGVLSPAAMPLNDPVAMLVAADPALAVTVPARVDVELVGRHTYGRTVIDFACRDGRPVNADVALSLNSVGIEAAFLAALTRLAANSEKEKR